MTPAPPSDEAIEARYAQLDREAEEGGYHLNPDREFTRNLVRGLLVNEQRYGYPSCPCRASLGKRDEDRDIICPCDYRDPDLDSYDACYCALYVSGAVLSGEVAIRSIPERRPPRSERKKQGALQQAAGSIQQLAYPVWRCRVCGYLCARESPPHICPVCKATKDRFERFL